MSKDSKLLRTDLPPSVWNQLAELAEIDGVKIGVYVKHLLIEHVERMKTLGDKTIPPAPAPAPAPHNQALRVTTEQWNRLNKWLAATGRSPDPSLLISTKSALMQWAITQGFKP